MTDLSADQTDNKEAQFRALFEPRIKTITLGTLPAFITDALAFEHDYGSICLALAFIGAAAAWAAERSPQGGITGFQGSCVTWEFLHLWDPSLLGKTATRILNYDKLLYPQYAEQFTSVSKSTFEKVQKLVLAQLGKPDDYVSQVVWDHWQTVAAGVVPFGLKLTE